jgi:hypothetical protein
LCLPVESSAKTRPLELTREKIEVRLGQPCRQLFGFANHIQRAPVAREKMLEPGTRRCVARRTVKRLCHGLTRVRLKVRFGPARLSEVVLIEPLVLALDHFPHCRGSYHATRDVREAEQRTHPRNRSGTEQRAMPRHASAPVVTNKDRVANAERVHEPDDVADQIENIVGRDFPRGAGLTVPALLWRNGAKTCRGDSWNLMTSRVPAPAGRRRRNRL